MQTLSEAELQTCLTERHDEASTEIADRVRKQLFAAEMLVGLGKLSWPGFDFRAANELARQANAAISSGQLGYALITSKRALTADR